MSTWVIPYVDQELSFWDEVKERFGTSVREVYFPMPAGTVASGRSRQPERWLETFLEHVPFPKAVLVNPIVLCQPAETLMPQIVENLTRLYERYGVASVTVTNLDLARSIREALPQFTITASTLMQIIEPAQVLWLQDCVDVLVPDSTILRNLPALKRLRAAFSGEFRLLVNEACLPGCPYRTQHFYEMAYSNGYPQSLCHQMLTESPWLRLTGAWVLPRHIVHYEGLYDSLKLAGRVTLSDRARYLSVLDAYIHGRDILPRDIGGGPASVLDPIDIPDEVFLHILHCDKHCNRCTFCRNYYEQTLDKETVQSIVHLDEIAI